MHRSLRAGLLGSGMADEADDVDLEALEVLRRITDELERSGEALTRTTLMRRLDIASELFTRAADHGCACGVLERGSQNYYTRLKAYVVPEEAYYGLVQTSLEALWRDERYDPADFYVEKTARRDSKIEGPWTRPDLTLVSYKRFPWTIGTEFDVVTFEVKRPDSANVLAVFEALSHASAATRAYVVFPIEPKAWRSANPAQEKRVRDECIRHGVGLILVHRKGGKIVQHHELKAARREIDHDKCSDFLDAVLTDDGKRRISAWKS
ncbi:MAG: hypothetical protein EBR82_05095 [Caulobacteraceae bacterium]|nr:hypothetical protein [Caulobacteraceae bacterium]